MTKGYIGGLGQGKTLNMVKDLMEQMKRGRKVISNTPIMFYDNGRKYESVTISDSKQFERAVINAWNATIAVDEASVFFPASYFNKIKPEFIYKFAQSRKMRVDFVYTSQGWGHTIKRLRDLTNFVVQCYRKKFIMPFDSGLFRVAKKDDKYIKKLSPHIRRPYIYHARLYSPEYFLHRILDPKKRKRFIIDQWSIYPSEAKDIFKAYNTYFRVKGSALANMKDIEENYNANEFGGNNMELIKEDTFIPFDSSDDFKTANISEM
jgi:hypothetical protein